MIWFNLEWRPSGFDFNLVSHFDIEFCSINWVRNISITKPLGPTSNVAILLGLKVFSFINVFDMIVVCINYPSKVTRQFGIIRFSPFFEGIDRSAIFARIVKLTRALRKPLPWLNPVAHRLSHRNNFELTLKTYAL